MNRRSFFGFACGGVVAAAAAPFAKPAVAEAIYIQPFGASLSCGAPAAHIVEFGQSLYLGDMLPTYWKNSEGWALSGPLDDLVADERIHDPWHMTARASQAVYDGEISVDEANAAYWGELDEVPA